MAALPRRYAHLMAEQIVDTAAAAPTASLDGLVTGYVGSRVTGFAPGVHRGLPTHHVGLIIALDQPIHLAAMPDRRQPPGSFQLLAYGLRTGPAEIAHDGTSFSVSVDLTPAGARRLLGVPAAALAGTVVSLDELLGRTAAELAERLAAASGWPARFAVLDELLTRRAGAGAQPAAAPTHMWRRIVDSGGSVAVAELAAESGYSRQHLRTLFAREYGLGPKQVARLVRFGRSHRMLRDLARRRPPGRRISLAEVAGRCGYFDQAHLAREWNELAGCPPSTWLASEELPFVQDQPPEPLAPSVP
jgi:AraC-like DNA-binding protein